MAASLATVTGCGCPYSFARPAEMRATVGRVAASSPSVVDDSEP
jgi:hypothetical protein